MITFLFLQGCGFFSKYFFIRESEPRHLQPVLKSSFSSIIYQISTGDLPNLLLIC